jgi:hypothetical protein
VSIEKVVPLIKTFKTIFYSKFFKFGKIGFGLNQVQKELFSKLLKFGAGGRLSGFPCPRHARVLLPLSPPPISYRALL